jgi:hypothetical protein
VGEPLPGGFPARQVEPGQVEHAAPTVGGQAPASQQLTLLLSALGQEKLLQLLVLIAPAVGGQAPASQHLTLLLSALGQEKLLLVLITPAVGGQAPAYQQLTLLLSALGQEKLLQLLVLIYSPTSSWGSGTGLPAAHAPA